MQYIGICIIVLALIYGGITYQKEIRKDPSSSSQGVEVQNPDSVTSYISKNITALSPDKPANGTFYVTNITLDSGQGIVEYEDGHYSYVANFAYAYKANGEVEITRFEVQQ